MDQEIRKLERQIELGDESAKLKLQNSQERAGLKDRPSTIYWIYSEEDTSDGLLEGVYKSEAKAKEVKKHIDDKSYKHLPENSHKYIEWDGYFESLEEVQIHKFELKGYINDLPEKRKIERKTARQNARDKKAKKRKKKKNKQARSEVRVKNRGWNDDEHGCKN